MSVTPEDYIWVRLGPNEREALSRIIDFAKAASEFKHESFLKFARDQRRIITDNAVIMNNAIYNDAGADMSGVKLAASMHLDATVVEHRLDMFTHDDMHDETYIQKAQAFHRPGELEIDPQAVVSATDDGAYVMAWVFVEKDTDLAPAPPHEP